MEHMLIQTTTFGVVLHFTEDGKKVVVVKPDGSLKTVLIEDIKIASIKQFCGDVEIKFPYINRI